MKPRLIDELASAGDYDAMVLQALYAGVLSGRATGGTSSGKDAPQHVEDLAATTGEESTLSSEEPKPVGSQAKLA